MNTQEAARLNLERAGVILEEAHHLRDRGVWNLVVRRCQEAVELALKGILWWVGLEVPWVHDVGVFLRRHGDRFPTGFAPQVPRLASISRALGVERERSFYGDEESGLPPEMLYSEHDADEALEKATFVLDVCRRLLEGGEG
ncbi:MAG: HEPN domain-containing protein [Ardenticatenia bacterium]|nr:HEPN domain-containing protein [Ardenticatenia bacterium]